MLVKRIALFMILLITASFACAGTSHNWNDEKITWISYEDGKTLASRSGKPMLVIFYAQWCDVCASYSSLFDDEQITALAAEFVMARVDVDQFPQLNEQFGTDGLYLPRTIAMNAQGDRLQIESNHPQFKYFFVADDVAQFKQMMETVLVSSALQPQ